MKVYLFISKKKQQFSMYQAYFEALKQKLDIATTLVDADIVLLMGAWTMKGAQLAKHSRKMGIPYIVCPLGDISERNLKNPHLKRVLQAFSYQKKNVQEGRPCYCYNSHGERLYREIKME